MSARYAATPPRRTTPATAPKRRKRRATCPGIEVGFILMTTLRRCTRWAKEFSFVGRVTMPRMTNDPTYGCATAARRSLAVNGFTLRALEWGTRGRPVLCFLHGGSAHAHWWDGVAPTFADRYHVVALDQRGHGESDWPAPGADGPRYATADFASDLFGVMDALGCRDITLCGHSMGGHNAMA